MRLENQRAVWNKLRDDQKFQLCIEMTDELESAGVLCSLPDEDNMYWNTTGDRLTDTVVHYTIS